MNLPISRPILLKLLLDGEDNGFTRSGEKGEEQGIGSWNEESEDRGAERGEDWGFLQWRNDTDVSTGTARMQWAKAMMAPNGIELQRARERERGKVVRFEKNGEGWRRTRQGEKVKGRKKAFFSPNKNIRQLF